ncbi:MAG: ankyrin repeat domain-containing protein [Promethearchaeota archaeon]
MSKEADEQLLKAAGTGDLKAVKAAIGKGADVMARGDYNDTALNIAAEHGHLDVVKYLVKEGADVNWLGGADKSPLMNATFAGHFRVVEYLLGVGARISNDLMSSLNMKVGILIENSEAGMVRSEAADAWRQFLNYMAIAQLKQELPNIISSLDSDDVDIRNDALNNIAAAARKGMDVSTSIGKARPLLEDDGPDVRYDASIVITTHLVNTKDWAGIEDMFRQGDMDVRAGAISVLVDEAKGGTDLTALLDLLLGLCDADVVDLRHDAIITIGYLATNEFDVSRTIGKFHTILSDPDEMVRKIGAWAIYRMAKYGGLDVKELIPDLKKLQDDEDEDVRGMASEALDVAGA